MKASAGFTKLMPTGITVVAYLVCFYFFTQSLKSINLSIAYATWGGLGIILTSIVAVMVWHEHIALPEIIGIGRRNFFQMHTKRDCATSRNPF